MCFRCFSMIAASSVLAFSIEWQCVSKGQLGALEDVEDVGRIDLIHLIHLILTNLLSNACCQFFV